MKNFHTLSRFRMNAVSFLTDFAEGIVSFRLKTIFKTF